MKSRPIMFGVEMVRAILAGQKTQTRRVVNPKLFSGEGVHVNKCPYGVVGDRLWVRESYFPHNNRMGDPEFSYKADDLPEFDKCTISRWKSPVFMSRAASRIELEITDIRVERVQDISEADALAEGCFLDRCPCPEMQAKPRHFTDVLFQQSYCHIHGYKYGILWESINGKKHPWDSNPWVWVVEFKRVEVQSTINHYEAIALAEKHEDSHSPEVTKSQLLDSLKSLIKLNGHRDPISDKLLPPDLQPDPEIGEAMRLVVSAGGAL